MKRFFLFLSLFFLFGCTTLDYEEKLYLDNLAEYGVTPDSPVGNFKRPANPAVVGALNVLPGVGNFYLGVGDDAEPAHLVYGVVHVLTWPFSILWSVPAVYADSKTVNEKALVRYYRSTNEGQYDLWQKGIYLP